MRRFLPYVSCGLAAFLIARARTDPPRPPVVRVIPLPEQHFGMVGPRQAVINSAGEWDEYRGSLVCRNSSEWSRVERAVAAAGVDYARESLVVIVLPGVSSSRTVRLGRPRLWWGTLTCPVETAVPQFVTCDSVTRCLAVAVDKGRVRRVVVRVDGEDCDPLAVRPR